MALYAMRVKKADLGLITLLNDGLTPLVENSKKSWFIFEIDDEGRNIWTDIVSEKTLGQHYDVLSTSPFVVRLKKVTV